MLSLLCREGEGCTNCGICKINNHIEENYSHDVFFNTILMSDTMLDLFLSEISFGEGEYQIVSKYMESLREEYKERVTLTTDINPQLVINNNGADDGKGAKVNTPPLKKIRYVATDYNTKVKQMELMDEFLETLQNKKEGISKTSFLKSISKDNLGGRKDFDTIIQMTIREGLIVKVGRNFYLRDSIINQENSFHRKVYHIIFDNEPVSSSGILTKLNYRNAKGRRKLLQILKLMSEEDLINYSSNNWSVKR
tara:strand:- start:1092 stop:1847 length:756 start_codon:yes stop_codon:yes gene_type:complete